jgi:hypothetical protein
MKVLGWLTHCEKIITLDFVSGDNSPPRVLMYRNTFIQGQYAYINTPTLSSFMTYHRVRIKNNKTNGRH